MNSRRLLAGALWFLTGWYLGSALAWMTGLDSMLAPVIAIAAAAIVAIDPRRVIWTARAMSPAATETNAKPA